MFVPQGADDAENQARYRLVDLVLDPMPYGGVERHARSARHGRAGRRRCVGKRHAERTAYSMLENLGVTETVASSGREYVDLASRLATDHAFARAVREKIRAGLAGSPLDRHARARAPPRGGVPRSASTRGAGRPARARGAGLDMSRASLAAIEAHLSAGDPAAARTAADALLAGTAIPLAERVAALKLRARAHEAMSNPRAAIVDLEGVLALTPGDARACNELGLVCADAGEKAHALEAFRRATRLDAGFARGWNNYGNALRAAGRFVEAADAFVRATAADAEYALAWANLGAVRRELGDDAGAEAALTRALALNPNHRVAAYTLAGLRRDQSRLDAAATLYEQAARLDPRDANAPYFLGGTLAERDDLAGAARAFDVALARDGRMLRAAIARRLTLPMVPDGAAAIAAARARYAEGLEQLAGELPQRAAGLSAERAIDELRWSNFLLAYHGEDDRPLQRRYADVVRGVVEARAREWQVAPSRRAIGNRIRVGFVSAFFRDGTAGRYFRSWITDLPRDRFEVVAYHLQPAIDPLARRLVERADLFRHCARWRPSELAPQIRGDALDVLVYPELGMDATTFALASLRLAPRQCCAWGHPVTTGLPTIDAFFSCAEMETDASTADYTESLVRLPGIGTRYEMPEVPEAVERARFGLPDGVPLFLCPQSHSRSIPTTTRSSRAFSRRRPPRAS